MNFVERNDDTGQKSILTLPPPAIDRYSLIDKTNTQLYIHICIIRQSGATYAHATTSRTPVHLGIVRFKLNMLYYTYSAV